MKSYSHFQFAWVIVVGSAVLFLLIFLYLRNRPESFSNMMWSGIVLFAVVVLFFGLKVKIVDSKLSLVYGVGVIRKTINLQNVESCEVSSYGWLSGFGIRVLRSGVLYNVSGTKAVTLKMKGKSRFVMVGTDEPEELKKAIDQSIQSNTKIK